MEGLVSVHKKLISLVPVGFTRGLQKKIHWNARFIGIIGARGVGKTTFLLQYIRKTYGNSEEALYVSLDHIWFSMHTLMELAEEFTKTGGKVLVLDEVHKYSNWAVELKNIYDFYPELQVVFTGSSLLEILNARADLSRRALIYEMEGLSFREFLAMETGEDFPVLAWDDLLKSHGELAIDIVGKIKPLKYFPSYLRHGYYPFYKEFDELFEIQLGAVVNMILEVELPLLRKVDIAYIAKVKQLLKIIADSVPFIPNISKISQKIGINRQTLLTYLHYLEECKLTKSLYKDVKGISLLQKPGKLFLENTNLAYTLGGQVNEGNLRETFFYNQVATHFEIEMPDQGDFLVDGQYLFEVGGKGKKAEDWLGSNGYIAADGIETGFRNKIPLWMFGFLY